MVPAAVSTKIEAAEKYASGKVDTNNIFINVFNNYIITHYYHSFFDKFKLILLLFLCLVNIF